MSPICFLERSACFCAARHNKTPIKRTTYNQVIVVYAVYVRISVNAHIGIVQPARHLLKRSSERFGLDGVLGVRLIGYLYTLRVYVQLVIDQLEVDVVLIDVRWSK